MGTTAQKLQYLVNAKASIDAALTAKGVTPPAAFGDYGNAIANIPSGGSNKLPQVIDRTVTEITADDLEGATSIGLYAFRGCIGLTSVTIPNGVTSIEDGAFYSCTGLTSISIPNSVTRIGSQAVYNCTSLTSATIPNSVTRIGTYAFWNCQSLTSVTIEATTPPVLGNANAFTSTNDCPIYVPAASVDTYKAATNWASLASRIFAIQE